MLSLLRDLKSWLEFYCVSSAVLSQVNLCASMKDSRTHMFCDWNIMTVVLPSEEIYLLSFPSPTHFLPITTKLSGQSSIQPFRYLLRCLNNKSLKLFIAVCTGMLVFLHEHLWAWEWSYFYWLM